MKTFRKPLLLGLLTFLSIMLAQAWMVESVRKKTIATDVTSPELPTLKASTWAVNDSDTDVKIETDVLRLYISKIGGGIYRAELIDYANSINSSTPFTLFNQDPSNVYGAVSGFTGDETLVYTPKKPVKNADNTTTITLTAKNNDGIIFTKAYTLSDTKYDIKVVTSVKNTSKTAFSSQHYVRFRGYQDTDISKQPIPKPKDYVLDPDQPKAGFMSFNTYQGPSYYSDDKPYVKVPFTEFATKPIHTSESAWLDKHTAKVLYSSLDY